MSRPKSFTIFAIMILLAIMSLHIAGCESTYRANRKTQPKGENIMSLWKNVLTLDEKRSITKGSQKALSDAIRNGADLRIYTTFKHNEHIEPGSDNPELIEEVSQFPVTYLIEDNWAAGIMTWRQPVNPSNVNTEFGPASMSFFIYNQDGGQAIARPYLDGRKTTGQLGKSLLDEINKKMLKYHQADSWDEETNAPSSNFIYDFGEFRYFVRDDWKEVLSHEADGNVISGSIDDLAKAFAKGAEIKVAIDGLCDDLATDQKNAAKHEIFVNVGAGYYYTKEKLFIAGTHHLVRVAPAAPLVYKSKNWDFGWVIVRTDGLMIKRICDPYTLKFTDTKQQCKARWFVR